MEIGLEKSAEQPDSICGKEDEHEASSEDDGTPDSGDDYEAGDGDGEGGCQIKSNSDLEWS